MWSPLREGNQRRVLGGLGNPPNFFVSALKQTLITANGARERRVADLFPLISLPPIAGREADLQSLLQPRT